VSVCVCVCLFVCGGCVVDAKCAKRAPSVVVIVVLVVVYCCLCFSERSSERFLCWFHISFYFDFFSFHLFIFFVLIALLHIALICSVYLL